MLQSSSNLPPRLKPRPDSAKATPWRGRCTPHRVSIRALQPTQRPLTHIHLYANHHHAVNCNLSLDVPPIFSSGLNASFPVVFPLC